MSVRDEEKPVGLRLRLPGHDQSASLFLEDLLDAEDRLVSEEERVAASQTNFAVAQVELKRALGELIMYEPCGPCLNGTFPMPAHWGGTPSPADASVNEPEEPLLAPDAAGGIVFPIGQNVAGSQTLDASAAGDAIPLFPAP